MFRALLSISITLSAVGCIGSAQVYYQDQNRGVLVLDGDEDKAVEDAHKRMAAHCGPGRYQVTKRETIVVGHESYARSATDHTESEDRQRATASAGDRERERTLDTEGEVVVSESETRDSGPGYADRDAQTDVYAAGSERETERESYREGSAEAQSRDLDAQTRTDSVAGTREVREQRLHYQCQG